MTSSSQVEQSSSQAVRLAWTPAEEQILNGQGFSIERAELGGAWSEIARLEAPSSSQGPREVQLVTSRADEGQSITAGSFRLSLQKDGIHDADTETHSMTDWISFDASASDLSGALEALGNIGSVRTTRSGPDTQGGYQWTVTFMDAAKSYPALQVVTSTLDALASGDQLRTVTVSELRPGTSHTFPCINDPDRRAPSKSLCTFFDDSVLPYHIYMYRIRALLRGPAGERLWSAYSEVSARVNIPGSRVLASASSLSLASVSAEGFRIAVQDSAPEGTIVQLEAEPGVWTTLAKATTGDTNDYEATGLDSSAEYAVRALVPGQDGVHTDTKVFRTADASLSGIELNIVPDGPESVLATWTQMRDQVTEFQLQARELLDGRRSTEYLDDDNGAWTHVVLEGLPQYHVGRAEVQTITTRVDAGSGSIDGGSYQLAFRDARSPSDPIAYDATASEVQLVLESLGVNVRSVTRSAPTAEGGYTYSVVFDPFLHPGDQPPLLVIAETLSTASSGSWSGAGGPVAVSTARDGVAPVYAAQSEVLEASVPGLKAYTWYAFRIRSVYVSASTGRLEAGSWSTPVGPVRTDMAPNALVDAPNGLDLQDARARALADVLVEAGEAGVAPRSDDPLFVNGVGLGGGASTGANGDAQEGYHGGPGLVVIRPRTSHGAGIHDRTWAAKVFFYTGTTQIYELPADARIDQLDIKMWGGGGGSSSSLGSLDTHGGAGAFVHARIALRALSGPLHVRVGGGGASGGSGGMGGWNGGGNGGKGTLRRGGGGGGASSIFLSDASSPILAAAGGGGAGGADYCCAHGGDAHGDGAVPDAATVLLGLPAVDENTAAFAEHHNKDLGLAPEANYTLLASAGSGATSSQGGQGGKAGSYESSLKTQASSGALERGGDGGSGHEGGGGGGGGFMGGGGGGSGVEGGGGGGGSSFVLAEVLFLSRVSPETPFASFTSPHVELVEKTSQTLLITWPAQHGARYIVEISRGLGNENFAVAKHVSGAHEALLQGLEPDAVYAVRVRAVSSRGGPERVGEALVVQMSSKPLPEWSSIEFQPFAMPLQTRLRSSEDVDEHLLNYAWEDDPGSGSGRANPATAQLQSAEARWMPRHGHTATFLDNGRIYMFGGFTDGRPCALASGHISMDCVQGRRTTSELWVFDPTASTWELEMRVSALPAPPPRGLHTAAQWENRLYVFGGIVYSRADREEVVGVSASEQRDAGGRLTSFSIDSPLSLSSAPDDWDRSALADFYVYDPTQNLQAIVESAAEVSFESAVEGSMLISPGTEASMTPTNANGEDLCVIAIERIELEIDHPCPNSLRVWLRGPGTEGRNVDDTFGTLLMDLRSSARQGCIVGRNDTLTSLILEDDAALSFRDGFHMQAEGTFRPASPLGGYAGVLYKGNGWSIAVADEELNGDVTGASLVSWRAHVAVHPCEPKPTWTQLAGGPPARYKHTSMSVNGQIFIFGGKDPVAGLRHDLWVYDIASGVWEERGEVDTSAVRDREMFLPIQSLGHLFVFDASMPHTLHTIDMFTEERVVVNTSLATEIPATRTAPAVVSVGTSLWVFGGYAGVESLDDTWRLALDCVPSNAEALEARCFGTDIDDTLACASTCTATSLFRAALCATTA
ncbi:Kelch domain-containing protein 10 [Hondaea fermentalgiana]|uniref:Kelch domain-containing protein 10 n=1 Tax=Hondaea fermentalgiana TaxID=2315210 RepID=A0A2R5GLU6_9STRA|nr:Kelch domain-containing protein 10 [Hondaea fermentalgiana]|eukprot:GBG28844.1 Kelch domain-containing protein 10 [Hondaea fermentalgiana]